MIKELEIRSTWGYDPPWELGGRELALALCGLGFMGLKRVGLF